MTKNDMAKIQEIARVIASATRKKIAAQVEATAAYDPWDDCDDFDENEIYQEIRRAVIRELGVS